MNGALRKAPLATLCPAHAELAADVRTGLGGALQKSLPARWLYDDVGSALYEAICLLPEYGVARAEMRVLLRCAPQLAELLPGVSLVVELGSGSGRKARPVLLELGRRGPVRYRPVDLSAFALERCRSELSHDPGIEVDTLLDGFLAGLQRASRARRGAEPLLVLFLGSTIGNFDRPAATAFLRTVRAALRPGDALLLGTDLVKPVPRLLAAYDDAAGVTAAFDLNVLLRLDRELGADFDPRRFAHEARWNAAERRIEMHLRARRAHVVDIPGAGLRVGFREDETLWTETSCKYEPGEPITLAASAGFRCARQWFDLEWPFAESLWLAT